jgi:sulfate adenylyltransferase
MQLTDVDYYNFLAIRNNLLSPLNKFMSFDEILSVTKNYNFQNNFFTLPFFLTCNFSDIKKIKNNSLSIFYKKKKIFELPVLSVVKFKKKELIDHLFNSKKFHPYKKFINESKNYLIETSNFSKKTIINLQESKITGFATRNIPHKGHEKIIREIIKKNKAMILINSEITKNKKTNILKTIRAYKTFIKKEKLQKKIILKKIMIPSTMLGYRQAFIHALIGKNLGCDSFVIGRDHSGYKNFYKEFESFNFCKKYQKFHKIKILQSGSPVFCKKCSKVLFRNEFKCNEKKIDISATYIRSLKNLNEKKLISNFLK